MRRGASAARRLTCHWGCAWIGSTGCSRSLTTKAPPRPGRSGTGRLWRARRLADRARRFLCIACRFGSVAQAVAPLDETAVHTHPHLPAAGAGVYPAPAAGCGRHHRALELSHPAHAGPGRSGVGCGQSGDELIKPSELMPRSSALLAELLHARLSADECGVVQGGPDVARALWSFRL